MTQRFIPLIFLLFATLFSLNAGASLFDNHANSQFVTVNQAFTFDFTQKNDRLTLSWQVKPGYYLYRQQIKIGVQGATLAEWQLPAGQPHEDEFYGKTEIYPDSLTLPFTVTQAAAGAEMTVTYQAALPPASVIRRKPVRFRLMPLRPTAPLPLSLRPILLRRPAATCLSHPYGRC